MFIFFLCDIILPEIVYNIRNYLRPNFIERYYLGLLNKEAYDFYKQKLLKLKSIAYTMINPYVHIPDYNIILCSISEPISQVSYKCFNLYSII